ncbi:MAG: hypothetical protein K2X82_27210 [Gemmataceae bacterium]|nr:hypothetical protein [Gemmataceae bacterium]
MDGQLKNYLATELTEGQKGRTDLPKWKLIAIGGLGGAGLGLSSSSGAQALWLLGLIPFLSLYVDLLYRNSCLRRNRIEAYIGDADTEDADTEQEDGWAKFIKHMESEEGKWNFFSAEATASLGATLTCCVVVVLLAFFLGPPGPVFTGLLVAGAAGAVGSVVVELSYWLLGGYNVFRPGRAGDQQRRDRSSESTETANASALAPPAAPPVVPPPQ